MIPNQSKVDLKCEDDDEVLFICGKYDDNDGIELFDGWTDRPLM